MRWRRAAKKKHRKWKCCLCGLEKEEQTNRLSEKPLILFVAAAATPTPPRPQKKEKKSPESHTSEGKTLK